MKEETIKKIISYLKQYSDVEIEFRLGNKYTDTFSSNITKKNYDIIMNKLEKSYKKGIFNKEIKEINDFFIKDKRISAVNDNFISIVKKKLYKEDFRLENSPMDIRLSVSREIQQEELSEIEEEDCFRRNKKRTIFVYKNWNYELTEVETIRNSISEITYEFELEINSFENENENENENERIEKILKSSYKKIFDVIGFISDS